MQDGGALRPGELEGGYQAGRVAGPAGQADQNPVPARPRGSPAGAVGSPPRGGEEEGRHTSGVFGNGLMNVDF